MGCGSSAPHHQHAESVATQNQRENNGASKTESKVVVITGASSGIGKAIAQGLAKANADSSAGAPRYQLVLAARRAGPLEAVVAEVGGNAEAIAVPTDVTKRDDVKRLLAAAEARFGRIDVLINNAGKGCHADASAITDDLVDEMMAVNVKSALYGMQEVLPYFAKNAGGDKPKGLIINVSSMLGRCPLPTPFAGVVSCYTGAKHFLTAITDIFRAEVKQKNLNVTVSLYSPGIVATDFGLNAGSVDNRQLPGAQDVDEVAAVLINEIIVKGREDMYSRDIYKGVVESYLKERHAQ